jgi:hypothetical protein
MLAGAPYSRHGVAQRNVGMRRDSTMIEASSLGQCHYQTLPSRHISLAGSAQRAPLTALSAGLVARQKVDIYHRSSAVRPLRS